MWKTLEESVWLNPFTAVHLSSAEEPDSNIGALLTNEE